MRVLLVLPAMGKSVGVHLGLAMVSSALRQAGHTTALLKINRIVSKADFLKQALPWQPDVVAFTSVTHHWVSVREWAGWIKAAAPQIKTIAGGVHATVAPNSAKCEEFDAIVVGEGEQAMVELLQSWQSGSMPEVPGVCVKGNGWKCAPPRPFCQSLDDLPFADRTIFGQLQGGDLPVMAGRGCPFSCAYCCNHILKKVQDGAYVRWRSPQHVIAELKQAVAWQQPSRIIFEDDTFTFKPVWLAEFLPLYRKEIGLPFVANARVGHFDPDTARLLKDAGCEYVSMGVESGDEKLRREILGRDMSNEAIADAFDIARSAGLGTYAFYMVGFPNETAAMAQATLALHHRLQPSAGFQISVFYPYPNTRLFEICQEQGLLSQAEKTTFEGANSTLKLNAITHAELAEVYNEFDRLRLESSFADRYVAVHYPWAMLPLTIAGKLIGKARLLRWAKAARDMLMPAMEFNESRYMA